MTPREKFIKCLKREPITGHVPHFELVFFSDHGGDWENPSAAPLI